MYICVHLPAKSSKSFRDNEFHCQQLMIVELWSDRYCFASKFFWTIAKVIVAKALASIYLEKYYTTTTTYFRFPYAAGLGQLYPFPTVAMAMLVRLTRSMMKVVLFSYAPLGVVTFLHQLYYILSCLRPMETLLKTPCPRVLWIQCVLHIYQSEYPSSTLVLRTLEKRWAYTLFK